MVHIGLRLRVSGFSVQALRFRIYGRYIGFRVESLGFVLYSGYAGIRVYMG